MLLPLPSTDFNPTESGVPWSLLTRSGCQVVFSTPDGREPACDARMLDGRGLGPLAELMRADKNGRRCYREMQNSKEFRNPLEWSKTKSEDFAGILLSGGHAKGMREYLESDLLQKLVAQFFSAKKLVGAICHGVVLAARSRDFESGKSVLWGNKTTALLHSQEILAWGLTYPWLKDYYRTYSTSVESEVRSVLKNPHADFMTGPMPILRDSEEHLERGFVVENPNYVSARWPGDSHAFAVSFCRKIKAL